MKLESKKILQNDDFSTFSVNLTNKTEKELGMVNLIMYVPTGLKFNLNDLETMRNVGKIGNCFNQRLL